MADKLPADKCLKCRESLETQCDNDGDLWLICPKAELKTLGGDHEVYLITRSTNGTLRIY